MMTKKVIYVCSPVKGNIEENIKKARGYCKEVVELGHVPLAPHLALLGVLNDEDEQQRETALKIGLELLKRCDELWCFGNVISAGMAGEIERANMIGLPVKKIVNKEGVKLILK